MADYTSKDLVDTALASQVLERALDFLLAFEKDLCAQAAAVLGKR